MTSEPYDLKGKSKFPHNKLDGATLSNESIPLKLEEVIRCKRAYNMRSINPPLVLKTPLTSL